MAHRVADELISRLAEAGVERIYGVVGDSLNPVTDALRLNGKVKWIHVRNEEAAAFAAGAEGQLSGKLAACGGQLRPWQPSLDQRTFRRSSQQCSGACDRVAHSRQ